MTIDTERMTVAEFRSRWMQAAQCRDLIGLPGDTLVDVVVQSTFVGRFFLSYTVVR